MQHVTSSAAGNKLNVTTRRSRNRRRLIAAASAVPVMAALTTARAANLYWDINGSTVGANGATGTTTNATGSWDGTLLRWNTDSTGGGAGTFSAALGLTNVGVFSAGTNVTAASNITVVGAQQAGGLYVEEGTPTFSGATGSLTIPSSGGTFVLTSRNGNDSQINIPINGTGDILVTNRINGDGTGAVLAASSKWDITGSLAGWTGALTIDNGNSTSQVNQLQLDSPLTNTTSPITIRQYGLLGTTANATGTNINVANPISLTGDGWLSGSNGSPTSIARTVTYSGAVSGSSNLWLGIALSGGQATLLLGNGTTPQWSYTGKTYVVMTGNGFVRINQDNILPPTTDLTIGPAAGDAAAHAPIDLNSHNLQVASLANTNGAGQAFIYNLAVNGTPSPVTLTLDGGGRTDTVSFSGVIGQTNTAIAPLNTQSPYFVSGVSHVTAGTNISVIKAGGTTQVFSGANLYTGLTTISGGTLVLGKTFGNITTPGTVTNTVVGDVNVNTGTLATIGGLGTYWSSAGGRVTAGTGGILSPGGTGVGGNNPTVATTVGGLYAGSMTLNTGADLKFDIFSGTSFDSLKVTNDLTLDAGTHTVDVVGVPGAAGDYTLGSFGSVSDPNSAGFVLGAAHDPSNFYTYSLDFNNAAAVNSLVLHVTGGNPALRWDADTTTAGPQEGNGHWSDGSTNFIDLSTNHQATFQNSANLDVTIGNTPAANGGTITLDAPVRVGGKLIFGPIASAYEITDGGNAANTLTTVGGASTLGIDATSANATIDAAVTLEADQTWTVGSGHTLTVTKSVHATSSNTLTKTGSGTLIIDGTGGTIGAFQINSGTLETNDPNLIGPAAVSIGNGTTLRLRTPAAVDLTTGVVAIDTVSSGQTFTWDLGSNPVTFSGTVQLKGSVTKLGTGDWTLSGSNNNFSNSVAADALTIHDASTLHLASGTPLGSSGNFENLAFDNPSTLDVQTNAAIGAIRNDSQITKTGSGVLTVNASTTAVAGTNPSIDITAGKVQMNTSSGLGGGNANTFGQMAMTLENNTELVDNFTGTRNSRAITLNGTALQPATLSFANQDATVASGDSEFVGYNTNGTTFTNYGSVLTVNGSALIESHQTSQQTSASPPTVLSHQLDISMPLYVTSGSTLTLKSDNFPATSSGGPGGDFSKSAINLRGPDDASGHSGDGLYVAGGGTVDSSGSTGEVQYGATGRGKPIVAFGNGTATMKLGSHAFMRDLGNTSDTFAGTLMSKLVVLGGVNMRVEAPMNATYSDPNVVGVPAPAGRPEDGSTGLFTLNATGTNGGTTPSGYTRIDNAFTVMSPNRAHALSLQYAPDLTKLIAPIPGLTGPVTPSGTLTLAATDMGAGATGVINVGPNTASQVTLAVDNTANSGNLIYQFDGTADSKKLSNYAGLSIQRSNPTAAGSVTGQLLTSVKTPAISIDTTHGAQLDVQQKALIVDYTPGNSPIAAVSALVASGKNGGTWNGPGIMTSNADAQGGLASVATVVAAEASDALGLTSGQTRSFRGQTIDDSSVIAAYVYRGDANLDGVINADDYFVIDNNYNKGGTVTGYVHGDFNEDGQINGDDYHMIDMNFAGHQGPLSAPPLDGLAGVSAVPEPAMLGLFAMALPLLGRRRRAR